MSRARRPLLVLLGALVVLLTALNLGWFPGDERPEVKPPAAALPDLCAWLPKTSVDASLTAEVSDQVLDRNESRCVWEGTAGSTLFVSVLRSLPEAPLWNTSAEHRLVGRVTSLPEPAASPGGGLTGEERSDEERTQLLVRSGDLVLGLELADPLSTPAERSALVRTVAEMVLHTVRTGG